MAEVTISIPQMGLVRGVSADGVTVFKGIPYAAPPAGPRRWQPPQPVAPWEGVRAADRFGAACLQVALPGYGLDTNCAYSEDCLYLNVWRPDAASRDARLPVMVWIHGGGFVFGSGASPMTDGTNLAQLGVIIVSINYRLGRFGWFAHPDLTEEAEVEPTGNFGLMDQIAALRWVQDHIAAFDGDPANVTIFGVSAGARSVHMLMSAGPARGLFAKAIAQTSGPRMRFRSLATAEGYGQAFAVAVGAPSLAELRALPADTILNAPTLPEHETAPLLDGRLITEQVDLAFQRGLPAQIPHILGSNDFEASNWADFLAHPEAILAKLPEGVRNMVMALYGPDAGGDLATIVAEVITDQICTEPARFVAQQHAGRGLPTYRYLFAHVPEGLRDSLRGAGHGAEQPYVFGNLDAVPSWNGVCSDRDRRDAAMIGQYWTNFAKTGDPNGPHLPAWPRDGEDELLLLASGGPRAESSYLKSRLDLWARQAGVL